MDTEPHEWPDEVEGEPNRDPYARQALDAEVVSEWEQFIAQILTVEGAQS